ncbi:MAG: phosphoribosylformylglycinamidine synthase subunit PurQ [Verrucomicrobiota bacterium]
MAKFVIIQFPGSNCDQDCYHVLKDVMGQQVRYAWHKDSLIEADESIILPGGFSYGDYLRTGSIARFSPIMSSVIAAAKAGQPVLGICNGFQILCEAGLLPGALVRNRDLHFVCETALMRVEANDTLFTRKYQKGQHVRIPIAHGEGCYVASEQTIRHLNEYGQVLFRYVGAEGQAREKSNPNGSIANIAGICNSEGNVLGMMPHPERASESLLGSEDGKALFESMIRSAAR